MGDVDFDNDADHSTFEVGGVDQSSSRHSLLGAIKGLKNPSRAFVFSLISLFGTHT